MSIEQWTLLLNGVNLAVVAVAAVLLWYQIRSNNAWNRRKATHDVVSEIILGAFVGIRRRLEEKIDPYDQTQTYATKKDDLTATDEQLLRDLLNYLEEMCLAIKHAVIDEEIAYDSAVGLLVAYARWAKPYIKSERKHSSRMWIEIELLAHKWEARQQSELQDKLGVKQRGLLSS